MNEQPNPTPATVMVGRNGMIYADGVRIGKLVGNGVVQITDPDRRRCIQKGREVVEVRLSDLSNLPSQK